MNSSDAVPEQWLLTAEYLDDAERDVLPLLAPDVVRLLRPTLRPDHETIVERIARLPWDEEPVELAVRAACAILVDSTVPGGLIDPADDQGDVPWCAMLVRLLGHPMVGSKRARHWFGLLLRFRFSDVPVSPVAESTAAYAVALSEHLRGRQSEARYWMRVAAIQTEDDDQPGMSIAMVIRAARLLRVPTS